MPSQLAGRVRIFAPSERRMDLVGKRCCSPSHQIRSTSKTRAVTARAIRARTSMATEFKKTTATLNCHPLPDLSVVFARLELKTDT